MCTAAPIGLDPAIPPPPDIREGRYWSAKIDASPCNPLVSVLQALDEFEGKEMVNTSPLYFSRTRGLFRECFPGEKSEDPEKTAAPLGKFSSTITPLYVVS